MRGRRSLRIAVIIALIAALAGCVSVPTEGPVEKVEGQQPACQNCVNVEVAPPAPGDDPLQIVEGYLRATSNYQAGYSIAKQYLTREATEKWSPESGVTIYSGSPAVEGESVVLDGRLVGSLATDRTYKSGDRKLNVNFGLVQEDGEWRINNPPPGLLVAEFVFRSFYRAYQLYFVSNDSVLVPDTIYLPTLPNPANVASALMKALLKGPSSWLDLVADSAIPPETTLGVESVTITDGIAEVALSDPVLALPDARRSLLAAQIVYTLKQAVGVEGVVIRVNQEGYRVPESDESTLAVGVEDIPTSLEPVPLGTGDPLYAVIDNEVQRVNSASATPEQEPLVGDLGAGKYAVDSLAVSPANTDVAVVTNGRTVLRHAPTGTGEVETLPRRFTDLLRPQFTRYGELWAIGRVKGRQRIWVLTGGEPVGRGRSAAGQGGRDHRLQDLAGRDADGPGAQDRHRLRARADPADPGGQDHGGRLAADRSHPTGDHPGRADHRCRLAGRQRAAGDRVAEQGCDAGAGPGHRRRIADHGRGRAAERLGRPRGDRTDADPIGGRRRR